MATVYTQAFTGTDGTNLDGFDGGKWSVIGGGGTSAWDIDTNHAVINTQGNTSYAPALIVDSATIANDNYRVEADHRTHATATNLFGIVARAVAFSSGATEDVDGYFLFCVPGTGLRLYKRVSGGWTEAGGSPANTTTISASTTYTLKLTVDGGATNEVVGEMDTGQNQINYSDTSITARNGAGFGLGQGGSYTIDDTRWWDDFLIDDLAVISVTDVANSGETPGSGTETFEVGSTGNVATGTGFV